MITDLRTPALTADAYAASTALRSAVAAAAQTELTRDEIADIVDLARAVGNLRAVDRIAEILHPGYGSQPMNVRIRNRARTIRAEVRAHDAIHF